MDDTPLPLGTMGATEEQISRTTAIILLLFSTGLVAVCANFMVDSIDSVTQHTVLSDTFVGLILLPIIGNAAEHVTAVTVASKNKMDLAIGVAVGSSIQIGTSKFPPTCRHDRAEKRGSSQRS
jgi:calcium/proton exchanger cax